MIKIPITYEDFDGNTVTKDYYFHLSKSELIDLETGEGESLSAKLERVSKSNDGGLIMRTFKEIIAVAYGQRVDGSGSEFYKDPDLTKRFLGSLAFDQLLTDLLTDTTDAIKFVNGLMPSGLEELAAKVSEQQTKDVPLPVRDTKNSGLQDPFDEDGNLLPWAFREPTSRELAAMSTQQLHDVYRRRGSGWSPADHLPEDVWAPR